MSFLACLRITPPEDFNDSSSLLSRFIAMVDRGVWSHAATYTGAGTIIEAVTSGVVERSIDVYKRPSVHVGIYRVPLTNPDKGIAFARSKVGAAYNYRGAMKAGLQKILCLKRNPTPNDQVLASDLDLVGFV